MKIVVKGSYDINGQHIVVNREENRPGRGKVHVDIKGTDKKIKVAIY
jgi:hypothetical protein